MGFLAPAFFGGLLAIGIPIAIHLINRERRVVVQFPSLMFLRKVPYRSVRRQKLHVICCYCSLPLPRTRAARGGVLASLLFAP